MVLLFRIRFGVVVSHNGMRRGGLFGLMVRVPRLRGINKSGSFRMEISQGPANIRHHQLPAARRSSYGATHKLVSVPATGPPRLLLK